MIIERHAPDVETRTVLAAPERDGAVIVRNQVDDDHYISVPIQPFFELDGVGDIGVCHMAPGEQTCVFAIEEEDDGNAPHQYGPCDEFYYILEGEFTVWWGKDVSNLSRFFELKEGDCTYYPTGWKYKVENTGATPGKFLYFMSSPPGIERRFEWTATPPPSASSMKWRPTTR